MASAMAPGSRRASARGSRRSSRASRRTRVIVSSSRYSALPIPGPSDRVRAASTPPSRRSPRTPSSGLRSRGSSRSPSRESWRGGRPSPLISTRCSVSRTPPAGGSRSSIRARSGARRGLLSSASPATPRPPTPARRSSSRRAPPTAAYRAPRAPHRAMMPWCRCASSPNRRSGWTRAAGRWRSRRAPTISRCLRRPHSRYARDCWRRSPRATRASRT